MSTEDNIHPWPVEGRSEQVQDVLDRFKPLLPSAPRHRDPDQHSDCHYIAGTIGCLEAGEQMCGVCKWWAITCGKDD